MAVRRTKKRKPLRCKKPKKRVVVGKGRRRRAVCRAPKRRTPPRAPEPKIAYTPIAPAHSPAAPLPAPAPPAVVPHAETPPPDVLPVNPGFTVADAERLLWRAGFGPKPGEAAALAAKGLDEAVASLLRPRELRLVGPEPHDDDGQPLQRYHLWGHDHCWWLDRMIRSTHPLQERMTLILHDWFATSRAKVDGHLLLRQNGLLRSQALGNFGTLLHDITADAAMLLWLDGVGSTRWNPNENHAREIMELFTLGANRGAYTETDVREAARAMTGWRATWTEGAGWHDFRLDAGWHDAGTKTIFGQTGAFGWEDVVRLCLEHPQHPAWFVTKLWSAFVGERIDAQTQSSLEHLYTSSGREIAPVVEAILKHPRLYDGPAMVVPPVVHNAGLLRAVGRGIDTTAWRWLADHNGQVLFEPPNVAGWDESRWIDTSTWAGRWTTALYVLHPSNPDPWDATRPYDATESPATAVDRALAHLGRPTLTPEVLAELRRFAETALPASPASWQQGPYRAMRQTALRMLIATCSDFNAR